MPNGYLRSVLQAAVRVDSPIVPACYEKLDGSVHRFGMKIQVINLSFGL